MATISQQAGGIATQEKPLLDKRWLAFGLGIYLVFYMWVRWYEGVFGWSAGLDSFAPEFETYWMNFLYTEIVLEVTIASVLWGYLWKSRTRDMDAVTPREQLYRHMTHAIWMCCYAWRCTGAAATSPSRTAPGTRRSCATPTSPRRTSSSSI